MNKHWKHRKHPDENVPSILAMSAKVEGMTLVKIPGSSTQWSPLLREKFGDAAYITDFDPSIDHILACATAGCSEVMHPVKEGHSKTSGKKTSAAHFRSDDVEGHIDGCIFKKPEYPLEAAIAAGQYIVIMLDGDLGHTGPDYKYSKGGKVRSAYEHWSRYVRDSTGLPPATRSADNLPALLQYIDRVTALGGENYANDRLYFHHKGHLINLSTLRMDDPAMLEHPRLDMQSAEMVRQLAEACETSRNGAYGFIPPRLRRVTVPHNYAYDHETSSIILPQRPIESARHYYWLQERLPIKEISDNHYGYKRAIQVVDDLLAKHGHTFDLLTAPRMDPEMAFYARDGMANTSPHKSDMPVAVVEYVIVDADRQMQTVAKPAIEQGLSVTFSGLPLRPEERSVPKTLEQSLQPFTEPKQLKLF